MLRYEFYWMENINVQWARWKVPKLQTTILLKPSMIAVSQAVGCWSTCMQVWSLVFLLAGVVSKFSGIKMNFFSQKWAVSKGSILTTCFVFSSCVPYIFRLKRSRKSRLDLRHLGRFLSRVVLTSSVLWRHIVRKLCNWIVMISGHVVIQRTLVSVHHFWCHRNYCFTIGCVPESISFL